MSSLQIDELIRSRRRSLMLMITPDGRLVVRAPMRTSEKVITDFILKKAEWIKKKREAAHVRERKAPRLYMDGELFLLLGKEVPLVFANDYMDDASLFNPFTGDPQPLQFVVAITRTSDRQAMVMTAYRHYATRILKQRCEYYAKLTNLKPQSIKITAARRRWGSCSHHNNINFPYNLIMAPLAVVDYVVVHELVHIAHHNHSARFWNMVGSFMPDFKIHRAYLRTHGHLLNL